MKNSGEKQDGKEATAEKEFRKEHRERVREKFRKNEYRLNIFADYEVMEFLLFHAIPRKDTKRQAKDLLERFGSISGVLNAEPGMLCEVKDVGEQSAMFIKLIFEFYKLYTADQASKLNVIKSSQNAKDYMKGYLFGEQREFMYMACTGNNGKVLYFNRIAEGEPDSVSVVPTDIVKIALRTNAVRVVLAHNHPLGICNPSSQDLRMTSIISDELRRVGVELFDHVIIAPDGEYSMREKDMLP